MYQDAGYIEHIPYIFICAGFKEGGKDSCEVSMNKIRWVPTKSNQYKLTKLNSELVQLYRAMD